MQANQILNRNNTTIKVLMVFNRILKSFDCAREDILKNEFIKNIADKADIHITSWNESILKKESHFKVLMKAIEVKGVHLIEVSKAKCCDLRYRNFGYEG